MVRDSVIEAAKTVLGKAPGEETRTGIAKRNTLSAAGVGLTAFVIYASEALLERIEDAIVLGGGENSRMLQEFAVGMNMSPEEAFVFMQRFTNYL